MLLRLTFGAFAALLAVVMIGAAGLTTVTAQDASPVPATCVSPGLPPGTPTPMDDSMAGMDMGSPEAMEPGPEVAEPAPLPEGQPADEATSAEIVAALENFVACVSEGQAQGDPSLYVALETENYWMSTTGSANPYDRVASEMEFGFSSVELLSITDPMVYDDGRVSGDITINLGGHWVQTLRMLMTQDGDVWKLDEEASMPPDISSFDNVSINGVTITETTDEASGAVTYAFEFLGSTTIPQTDVLLFNVTNNGEEVHEAAVAILPEGADPLGLLDGSLPFEDITFIGVVFGIQPGQTMDLALVNLEPGLYHMVCFFPDAEGVPHAANGMVATFEVVAPAA